MNPGLPGGGGGKRGVPVADVNETVCVPVSRRLEVVWLVVEVSWGRVTPGDVFCEFVEAVVFALEPGDVEAVVLVAPNFGPGTTAREVGQWCLVG